MSWERYDEGGQRWTWDADDDLHLLLLLHDGELRELHVTAGQVFTHLYIAPELLADDRPRTGTGPLADAEHVFTHTMPAPIEPVDTDTWWRWLAEERYEVPE